MTTARQTRTPQGVTAPTCHAPTLEHHTGAWYGRGTVGGGAMDTWEQWRSLVPLLIRAVGDSAGVWVVMPVRL